jgi:hypothetical protein
MAFNPSFIRKLVRRGRYFSVSIPPQLAQILGDCQDVTIRANLSRGGIVIEPLKPEGD